MIHLGAFFLALYWFGMLLFSIRIFFKVLKLLRATLEKSKGKFNAAASTSLFISLSMLSSTSFCLFGICYSVDPKGQFTRGDLWINVSQALFGVFTITSSLNVSLLYLELVDSRSAWTATTNVKRTKKFILFSALVYAVGILALLTFRQFAYGSMFNVLWVALISGVFRYTASRLSTKLQQTLARPQREVWSGTSRIIECAKGVSAGGILFCVCAVAFVGTSFTQLLLFSSFLGASLVLFGIVINFYIFRYLSGANLEKTPFYTRFFRKKNRHITKVYAK